MALSALTAVLFLAPAPLQATDVAFEDLAADRNAAAIARLEGNESLEADDPARLINLGVAHAREGRVEAARQLFKAAVRAERLVLETAGGDWIDSRDLARKAIAALARGEFAPQTRTALR